MRSIIVASLILATGVSLGSETAAKSVDLSRDGIKVSMAGEHGYSIDVDGVSFSPVSTLFVVDPLWQKRYYGYSDDAERVSSAGEITTNSILTLLHSDNFDVVQGTQTLELLPQRRLRIALTMNLTSSTAAVMENRIASIGEGWLTNVKWAAVAADGKTTSGVTPRWAPSTGTGESTILSDFRSATLQTPRGPLTIETSGSATIALVDYRRNQYAKRRAVLLVWCAGIKAAHAGNA